ncbi:hypothetical protein [Modestobacter lapidis]|nr:hypothetical protein [Modestobacter lapidis]
MYGTAKTRPRYRAGRALAIAALLMATGCGGTDEPEVDPFHFGEMTFIGTVTSHDPYNPNQLEVDSADVKLNLIGPVDGGCFNAEQSLREQAMAAKESMLPVGTRVLVAMADDSGDWAFVHLLPAGSDTPEPPAPAASVNEQLVAGGFWEPDGFELDDDDSEPATTTFAIRYADVLSPVQVQYAPLIVAAGNATKAARTTGYGTCLAEFEQAEAERLVREEESRREFEEWNRRYRNSGGGGGGGYCRDGDGDGICYED